MRGFIYLSAWFIGWVFYKGARFLKKKNLITRNYSLSVIIPARNEEKNIGKLLSLLQKQTYKPYEIIVVDDNSEDNTAEIASKFNVKLIRLEGDPPEGWTGKNWAIWNGYLEAKGEMLLFLDADVEPQEDFIEVLLSNYEIYKGLISCWPYQRFEKFYEHLNMVFNLGALAIISSLKVEGAYGPVMLISREDYEKVGGHEAIKDKIVDDLYFGNLCISKGLKVSNFLGNNYVKFRMYPGGLKDLFEGFAKNSAKGAVSLSIYKLILVLVWFYGLCGSFILENVFNLYYLLFSFQIYVINRRLGDYNIYDALLYPIHFLFAFIVLFYSSLRSLLYKNVVWKGRKINVN